MRRGANSGSRSFRYFTCSGGSTFSGISGPRVPLLDQILGREHGRVLERLVDQRPGVQQDRTVHADRTLLDQRVVGRLRARGLDVGAVRDEVDEVDLRHRRLGALRALHPTPTGRIYGRSLTVKLSSRDDDVDPRPAARSPHRRGRPPDDTRTPRRGGLRRHHGAGDLAALRRAPARDLPPVAVAPCARSRTPPSPVSRRSASSPPATCGPTSAGSWLRTSAASRRPPPAPSCPDCSRPTRTRCPSPPRTGCTCRSDRSSRAILAAADDDVDPALDADEVFDLIQGAILGRIFVPAIAAQDRSIDRTVEMVVRILTPRR